MKPQTLHGYGTALTGECERMLVTLLRGLGPWKDSVILVGGLTPRYLVKARPPAVPEHAGTQDVDVVVGLQVLAEVEAYHTLESNLKKLGFERGTNDRAQKLNWRWEVRVGKALLRLEFLADMPDMKRVEPLPADGNLSALNVPHSSIVFDHYREVVVTAESLVEGYLNDGPVAVAKFEIGELDEDAEARVLRQREASFVVESLLRQV